MLSEDDKLECKISTISKVEGTIAVATASPAIKGQQKQELSDERDEDIPPDLAGSPKRVGYPLESCSGRTCGRPRETTPTKPLT